MYVDLPPLVTPRKFADELTEKPVEVGNRAPRENGRRWTDVRKHIMFSHISISGRFSGRFFATFFGAVFGAVFGTVFGTVFGSLHRAMVLDNRREWHWLRPMPIYTVVGFELGLATIGSGQDEAWPFMGRRRSAW